MNTCNPNKLQLLSFSLRAKVPPGFRGLHRRQNVEGLPRGSRFSILQTVMQLSLASLTTSYSISFQPRRLRSMNTCSEERVAAWH